jgi:hypothetical protein
MHRIRQRRSVVRYPLADLVGSAVTIEFVLGPALAEARRLAREAVRAELKSKGHKLQEFSFKQLVELGDEYLRQHSELIEAALARLDH